MIEIKNLTKVYKLNKKQSKGSGRSFEPKCTQRGNIWSIGTKRCREDDDTSLYCNDY